jgi:hypothetical protein
MTSLIICMWTIGIAIVDLVLFGLGQYILRPLLGLARGCHRCLRDWCGGRHFTHHSPPVSSRCGHCRICPYRALSRDSYYHARGHVGSEPVDKRPFGRGRLAATAIEITAAGAARTMSTAVGMTQRAASPPVDRPAQLIRVRSKHCPGSQDMSAPLPSPPGGQSASVAGVTSSGALELHRARHIRRLPLAIS